MFIQHGQFGSSFDQDRAFNVFNGAMSWRKRHDVHGRHFGNKSNGLLSFSFDRYFDKCISNRLFRSTGDLFSKSWSIQSSHTFAIDFCAVKRKSLWNILVHFVVRALNKGHEDNEAIKRFITYHLEKHIRESPGQKIVLLFDMTNAGISNLVDLFPSISLMIFF